MPKMHQIELECFGNFAASLFVFQCCTNCIAACNETCLVSHIVVRCFRGTPVIKCMNLIHVCMYACLQYAFMHVCVQATYTHMYMYSYVHMHLGMHIYTYMYINVCGCACMHSE